MKQPIFKQLLLLAVFLFAGIGSAFGQDDNYFHVEVNRVDAAGNAYPEEFDEVQVIFEREGSRVNVPTYDNFPKGYVYKMSIDNLHPDIYTVTSIVINGTPYEDPGQYENSENYIEISDPSDNLAVTVTISKAETRTITVHRNSSLSDIAIYCKDNDDEYYNIWISPMTLDDEKVVFEVAQGSDYQLEVYPTNQLAYRVSKVTVGSEDVTAYMNTNGHVIIPSVEDDIEVQAVVSKIDETKTISFSTVYDTGAEASCWLYFYDPARDCWEELNQKNQESVELLVGSTTQMTIETELGRKVKTLKVDGTDVTETYNSQGYYEFKDLDADHSVEVELVEAEIYTITINRDEIPADIEFNVNITYWGTAVYGGEYEFNEGTFVTLNVQAFVQDEDGKQFQVRIYDGDTDVTPDSPDEEDFYNYTIKNLNTNHEITLTYEMLPSITVNCFYNDVACDDIDFSLNDYYYYDPGLYQFAKGTDVTFSLRWFSGDKVVESIMIDEENIPSFNGSYVFSNLTENHVITITLSDAGTTYDLAAVFDESSTGTIYLKKAMTEKKQTNGMVFVDGSVATLFVKTPIGYEVSKIHLTFIDDNDERTEEDVSDISFNPDTKEYYCEVTITAPTEAIITTQKKPGDGTTDMFIDDDSGMATFCSEYDLDFSTEATKDIAAYVAIGYDSETNKLKMMRVTEAQRGTGLLVIGKPGSYTIPMKETSLSYQNLLKAVGEETIVPETEYDNVDYDNYVLLGSEFVKADETPIPAYQAYLQLPRHVARGTELISIEFIDMGDMNGDAKITITDAVMIVDKILNEQ